MVGLRGQRPLEEHGTQDDDGRPRRQDPRRSGSLLAEFPQSADAEVGSIGTHEHRPFGSVSFGGDVCAGCDGGQHGGYGGRVGGAEEGTVGRGVGGQDGGLQVQVGEIQKVFDAGGLRAA